jgi:uncharacterized protein YsxB (DUF464 family)
LILIQYKIEKSFYNYLKVDGHAPSTFGKIGENILCSAVSVLAQTLLLLLDEAGNVSAKKIEKGTIEMSISHPNETTNTQFEFFLRGTRSLQNQYKDILNIQKIGG